MTGHKERRLGVFIAILVGLLAAGCLPPELRQQSAAPTPSPTLAIPGPGVADILAQPPAAGESLELDAYFSGAIAVPFSGGPPPPEGEVVCPVRFMTALTDRPFPPALQILNSTCSNALPDDSPWLIAVTADMAEPGVRRYPQLPYHARLRGHLGDPAFAHCPESARIFMVEAVVKDYGDAAPAIRQLVLPAGYASWLRRHEAAAGYSLPVPPGWKPERVSGETLVLRAPQWPGYPVTVTVHAGGLYYDQYDPGASASVLLQAGGWGVYQQGMAFGEDAAPGIQGLAGYHVQGEGDAAGRAMSVLFSAHGRTYELSVRYPIGFEASQELLTDYSAIVEGFRLDVPPEPSPTPPVRQTLGAGPFLSQEEALASAREHQGTDLELLGAELVPEAEARRRAGACNTYTGHSEGVWLLTVRGTFEGQARTMVLYLDAASGVQLCGEEIVPAAQP